MSRGRWGRTVDGKKSGDHNVIFMVNLTIPYYFQGCIHVGRCRIFAGRDEQILLFG